MYKRSLDLSRVQGTFFLWGPRQSGKTTLLRQQLPGAVYVDLLRTDELMRYQLRPAALREELAAEKRRRKSTFWTVIDEIQRVPALLDEVQGLIVAERLRFALSGSSARKVRRGHGNLLGGRARRFELRGLSAFELGRDFDLVRLLNHGTLPTHYDAVEPGPLLDAYCTDYLKEEVFAEGLSRNLPAFHHFLEAAALGDGELVSYATIARDTGVSAPTVRSWFEVLEDTLLASFLEAYRRRPKRRVVESPKFYFGDVGVVNALARRGRLAKGSPLFGKAFESWVHHELRCFQAYREPGLRLSYWRLSTGVEVDFVVEDCACAIEAKASPRITSDGLKGLRELKADHPQAGRRVVVSLEPRARLTDDGIEVLPYLEFVERLWARELW